MCSDSVAELQLNWNRKTYEYFSEQSNYKKPKNKICKAIRKVNNLVLKRSKDYEKDFEFCKDQAFTAIDIERSIQFHYSENELMKLPQKNLIQKGKSIMKNVYGLVSSFLWFHKQKDGFSR